MHRTNRDNVPIVLALQGSIALNTNKMSHESVSNIRLGRNQVNSGESNPEI